MGFSRHESWSGLPFPSPGDLPDPGIEPRSSALEADALTSEPPGKQVDNYSTGSPSHLEDLLMPHGAGGTPVCAVEPEHGWETVGK